MFKIIYPQFFKPNSNETNILLLELGADFTQLHRRQPTEHSPESSHEENDTSVFLPKRPQCHLLTFSFKGYKHNRIIICYTHYIIIRSRHSKPGLSFAYRFDIDWSKISVASNGYRMACERYFLSINLMVLYWDREKEFKLKIVTYLL